MGIGKVEPSNNNKEEGPPMIASGTAYRCQTCQTEVEVVSSIGTGGPLVCCEVEMNRVDDEFDKLYEKEAYDESDFEWD